MRNFQELNIRQKSHALTLKIYSITKNFPKEEMFGIISQCDVLHLQYQLIFQKVVDETAILK